MQKHQRVSETFQSEEKEAKIRLPKIHRDRSIISSQYI